MPAIDEDWSDSDDEVLSDVETSVNLGIPDGALTDESELNDAAVSRIGGRPVRYCLSSSFSSVHRANIIYFSLLCFFQRHFFLPWNPL